MNTRLSIASVFQNLGIEQVTNDRILAYSGNASDRRRAMRADRHVIEAAIRDNGFGTVQGNGASAKITTIGHCVSHGMNRCCTSSRSRSRPSPSSTRRKKRILKRDEGSYDRP